MRFHSRSAVTRATASVLIAALIPIVTGCASGREYRLPTAEPIPPDRVLSVTMTNGRVIEFDEPGAIWHGDSELHGYVQQTPEIVSLAEVASLRLEPAHTGESTGSQSGLPIAVVALSISLIFVATSLAVCINCESGILEDE